LEERAHGARSDRISNALLFATPCHPLERIPAL
jgi:hypothetical protein